MNWNTDCEPDFIAQHQWPTVLKVSVCLNCAALSPFEQLLHLASLYDCLLFSLPVNVTIWNSYKNVLFLMWSNNTLYEPVCFEAFPSLNALMAENPSSLFPKSGGKPKTRRVEGLLYQKINSHGFVSQYL